MPKSKTSDTTASQAAAADAAEQPITVRFRGEDFEVPFAIRASARLAMAFASGQFSRIMSEALAGDPDNLRRFFGLLKVGESLPDVGMEFLDAFSEAGQGNS